MHHCPFYSPQERAKLPVLLCIRRKIGNKTYFFFMLIRQIFSFFSNPFFYFFISFFTDAFDFSNVLWGCEWAVGASVFDDVVGKARTDPWEFLELFCGDGVDVDFFGDF